MTDSKKIAEQINTIKEATIMATQSKESATRFLEDAGIIKNYQGASKVQSANKTATVKKK
jgi:hypothetical protein